jgi:hypothetical protein
MYIWMNKMLGSTTKTDVRTLKLHNVRTDVKMIMDLKNNEQNTHH